MALLSGQERQKGRERPGSTPARARSGLESLPESREGREHILEGGMVERVRRGWRPSQSAGMVREALLKGWKALGDPPGAPLGVRSPSLVGREGSEGPSYGMVGALRGRDALSERPIRRAMRGQQWSVGPPGGL